MKITLNWLKSHFVDSNFTIDDAIIYLENLAIEVEKIQKICGNGFVVAKILKITPHSNSNKLNICLVEYKINNIIQQKEVVCGASNIKENMYTILVLEGTILPSGLKIAARNIRGVISNGMLCAWGEIGLSHIKDNGILIEDTPFLLNYLVEEDYIIDISVTSNRNHLHYVQGIAQEISYLSGEILKNTTPPSFHSFASDINIHLNKEVASSFAIIEINNFTIHENYYEMLSYMTKITTPTSIPLVNICNFITYDMGLPLQIYNKKQISNNLYVTFANEGDILKDFKNTLYTLKDKDILIKDDRNILCLGGIVSGDVAKCELNTDSVIIEMALFNKKYLINTAHRLKIFTDSYQRFLRDIYPINYHIALQKLLMFLKGEFSHVKYFGDNNLLKEKKIFLSSAIFYKTTGISMSIKDMYSYLTSNGYECEILNKNFNNDNLNNEMGLVVTTHKHHVTHDKDIIEEILRISKISVEKNVISSVKDKDNEKDDELLQINEIKNVFVINNFIELINYSFDTKGELEIKNPIFIEKPFFKNSLINNIEENIKDIIKNRFDIYKIFEISHVFKNHKEMINLCFCIRINVNHWFYKNYPIILEINNILNLLNNKWNRNFILQENNIIEETEIIGIVKYGSDYCILEINDILKYKSKDFYKPIDYKNIHVVERDFSLVTQLSYKDIEKELNKLPNIIVNLKDIYENKNSLLINIKYLIHQNNDITISIEDITTQIHKTLEKLKIIIR